MRWCSEQLPEGAEALLIDTPSSELARRHRHDLGLVNRPTAHLRKSIIAGGLDAANVQRAIEAAQPWGVDACSRLEKSPGLKDHEKMRQFIKAALGS